MNMRIRPVSVTIISWFLVITSGWSIISTPFLMDNPITKQLLETAGISNVTAVIFSLFGGITGIISGAAMLNGKVWGRQLYLFTTPAVLLASTMIYGLKFYVSTIIGFVVYGIFFILLTRRPASEYFSEQLTTPDLSSDMPIQPAITEPVNGKRVAGILLLIPGGFMLTTWLMMILPLAGSLIGLIAVSVIFGFLTAVFVIPAIFLWGRHRWAGLSGTLLITVGGMLLMVAIMFYQITTMDEFRDQLKAVDPVMMDRMTQGSLTFGLGAVVIGVLLLFYQRRKDNGVNTTTNME